MTDTTKVRIVVDEDAELVARIDALADEEGTSRAAIVRRAIRKMLFSLPASPTSEKRPEAEAA